MAIKPARHVLTQGRTPPPIGERTKPCTQAARPSVPPCTSVPYTTDRKQPRSHSVAACTYTASPCCGQNSTGPLEATAEACALLQSREVRVSPLPSYHACIRTRSYLLPAELSIHAFALLSTAPNRRHAREQNWAALPWEIRVGYTLLRIKTTCRCMHPNATCSHRSLRSYKQLNLITNSHPSMSKPCIVLRSRARAQLPSRPSQHASLSLAHRHLCSAKTRAKCTTDNQPLQQTATAHTTLKLWCLPSGPSRGLAPVQRPNRTHMRKAVPPSSTLVNV